ncbi:hypothetical protein M404DRAFT_1000044, partial [Pisolithus tinctorius Marx 270]
MTTEVGATQRWWAIFASGPMRIAAGNRKPQKNGFTWQGGVTDGDERGTATI